MALVGPAAAQAQNQSDQQQDNPNNKTICKQLQVTGTLLPGPRVSHTKAEWDEIARQAEEETRHITDSGAPGQTH